MSQNSEKTRTRPHTSQLPVISYAVCIPVRKSFQNYSGHSQVFLRNLYVSREICSNYSRSGVNYKPLPSLSPGLFFCSVPQTCCRGQDFTCSTACSTQPNFPEMMLHVVEMFLIHDTRPPENMME